MIFLSVSVMAQEGDSIPQQQVVSLQFGYLSYDSALVSMPDYVAVQDELTRLRQAYEAELQRVEQEFNTKYEDFLEGQKDYPRTILLKRQTELQEMLQRNLQFKQQSVAELEQTRVRLLAPLRIRLNETIATLAREKGLALVVNTDVNACPFIEPLMGVDLNREVERKLNTKTKR